MKMLSLLLIAIGLQYSVCSASGDKQLKTHVKKDAVVRNCLEVSGRAMFNGQALKNVTVKLYKKDVLVVTIGGTDESKVFFSLEENTEYTLCVSKPGFADRMIRFDTHLPDDVVLKPIFRFDFDVEMVATSRVDDPYYFDFPAGIVAYNPLTDKFEHSKRYSACLNRMKHEALDNHNQNLGK